MVDAGGGVVAGAEAVEGAVLGEAEACGFVAVLEESGAGEDGEDLVVLIYVEVAGEHGEALALGHLLYALADELGGLAACDLTDVIHVEVEEEELLVGAEVEESSPGADAYAGGIPSECGAVGGFVEPEVAAVEQAHAVLLVEDGAVLAVLLAVVACHADVAVAVEVLKHVEELPLKYFLGAEDIGAFPVEHVAHDAAADVVGAHGEFLGGGAEGGQGEEEEGKEGGFHKL